MKDLVKRAAEFATSAHEGQVRKYTGVPYIVHPIEVMEIVKTVDHDDEMLAAALLHDVVEDCGVTIEDIVKEFGSDVASLVSALTDVSKPEDGNRKTRKAKDREHSAASSPRAQTIKLADLISNAEDIIANDPKFAKLFITEKRLLLEAMSKGDSSLHRRASKIVEDFYESR
jgi:(p)ppGpp synthase/HD superfamily hydrolase